MIGESLPEPARPGTKVFAGTLNLGAPLLIRVTEAGALGLLTFLWSRRTGQYEDLNGANRVLFGD